MPALGESRPQSGSAQTTLQTEDHLTTTQLFRKWSPEAEQALQDCFEITDWKALQGFHGENVEEMVNAPQTIFSSIVPASSVSCFANIKPWITSDLKDQR